MNLDPRQLKLDSGRTLFEGDLIVLTQTGNQSIPNYQRRAQEVELILNDIVYIKDYGWTTKKELESTLFYVVGFVVHRWWGNKKVFRPMER